MTRFWPKFGAIVVLCVLCFAAACLAEGEDAYVGGWELASYRAYKTVLDESPSLGLDLSADGSGRMRLTGGRELPLSWQTSEHGLRIHYESEAHYALWSGTSESLRSTTVRSSRFRLMTILTHRRMPRQRS